MHTSIHFKVNNSEDGKKNAACRELGQFKAETGTNNVLHFKYVVNTGNERNGQTCNASKHVMGANMTSSGGGQNIEIVTGQ